MIRNFPQEMKSKRKELNISISKLSVLTGINKSNLSRYESGIRTPSVINFLKICYTLQIDTKKYIKF